MLYYYWVHYLAVNTTLGFLFTFLFHLVSLIYSRSSLLLSILTIIVSDRLGLNIWGICFSWHFQCFVFIPPDYILFFSVLYHLNITLILLFTALCLTIRNLYQKIKRKKFVSRKNSYVLGSILSIAYNIVHVTYFRHKSDTFSSKYHPLIFALYFILTHYKYLNLS